MIRAGIAGMGRWGQVLVSSVQGKSDQIEFVAGCTGRKERAQAFCDENSIDLRDELGDLLGDDSLDAIVLATPHSQHAEQIKSAAKAGKAIFIEKPFTLDHVSAAAAVRAVEEAGVVCALGHNRRFLPSMIHLQGLVNSGEIGTVLHVESNISAGGALNYSPEHWRASGSESPAGGMTGLGVHMVDALISFLGPVTEVTAISERRVASVPIDDTTFMHFRFDGGHTGYMGTVFATAWDWRIQVFGDKGWVEMRGPRKLTISKVGGEPEVIEFEETDIERAELEAFATAITGGAPYPLPLDQAIHGTAILEAIIQSSTQGRTVKVAT